MEAQGPPQVLGRQERPRPQYRGGQPPRRPQRKQRPTQILAVLLLGAVTGGAVFALAYDLIVNGSSSAQNTLGLLATTGLGGLLVAAGAKADINKNSSSEENED